MCICRLESKRCSDIGGPGAATAREEAFIFPSKRDTPMRYDNYLKRVLKPAAEAVGARQHHASDAP